MQILVSLIPKANERCKSDQMFIRFDTNFKYILQKINIKNCGNGTKGTGMCQYDNYWFGGIICMQHRSGSKLVVIDKTSGNQKINNLRLTKAIHCITPLGAVGNKILLLANSTQNDLITVITVDHLDVVSEDVYFDFLQNKERTKYDWLTEYKHDDSFHVNSIYIHDKQVYASMFIDYNLCGAYKVYNSTVSELIGEKEANETTFGCIYNLTKGISLVPNLIQPHSVQFNSFENMIYCNSLEHTFNIKSNPNIKSKSHTNVYKLKGYSRGICEDKEKGGYWIGLSAHRDPRDTKETLTGAAIQFVPYNIWDMDVDYTPEVISLSEFGQEVFDIIPFNKGDIL